MRKMTPDQLKAYHARIANLRSKVDFSTQQAEKDTDHQKKSFIDADGDEEELYNYDEYDRSTGYYKKPPGYGMGYSHPRHLNNLYNTKIKNFKDMDRVIDENELLRVIDEKDDGRTISTGNTITQNQMDIVKANFEQAKEDGIPMRAKITSNSRKKFKTWEDFEKAVAEHQDDSKPDFEAIAESERRRLDNEDKGNKEFISHTARLAGN
jgi:hypothetical protein